MIFTINPKNKFGISYLAFWEDFLTQEDINKIISYPEWDNLRQASIGNSGKNIVDEKIRSTKLNFLPLRQDTLDIYEKISNVITEVNNRFFDFDITALYENIQLGLYSAEENGHYDWHVDYHVGDTNVVPRKLSMALLLNDPSEFEGGKFKIKTNSDSEQELELKKGRAWFFPSWTLHKVTPVTKGVRKSLVVWVGGPSFK